MIESQREYPYLVCEAIRTSWEYAIPSSHGATLPYLVGIAGIHWHPLLVRGTLRESEQHCIRHFLEILKLQGLQISPISCIHALLAYLLEVLHCIKLLVLQKSVNAAYILGYFQFNHGVWPAAQKKALHGLPGCWDGSVSGDCVIFLSANFHHNSAVIFAAEKK